jgi:hypothetical protein
VKTSGKIVRQRPQLVPEIDEGMSDYTIPYGTLQFLLYRALVLRPMPTGNVG